MCKGHILMAGHADGERDLRQDETDELGHSDSLDWVSARPKFGSASR